MEQENTQVNIDRIDLRLMLADFLQAARRLLLLGLIMVILFAALFAWRTYSNYYPTYQASASFIVTVTNPLYNEIKTYNTATAEQMAKTFPTILSSSALLNLVWEDLEVTALPPITASVLPNTNIFTLTVTSGDPQFAYQVLNSVIDNYPEIAEFVVGPTNMVLMSESGIPTAPMNRLSIASGLKSGVLAGLLIWIAIVGLFAISRSTVHNEAELKRLSNLRCLGTLPHIDLKRKKKTVFWPLLSEGSDRFGFSESVRLLRIRIEKEMEKAGHQVLLISSAIPGEGKTTVAANLALSLAQKGKRTLLIDFDLRSPSVNRAFGKKNAVGITDFLRGTVSAQDLINALRHENLYTIFAGTPASNAAELLERPELRELLRQARELFDYIILDTPPCAMLSDASEAASMADCALLTIRQNFAPKSQILEGAQLLTTNELPLLGCVLNGAKYSVLTDAYGYGYGYGYGNEKKKRRFGRKKKK